ncbi:MAG: hypothetical protein ABJ327_25740 [Litoreibacter sp.]
MTNHILKWGVVAWCVSVSASFAAEEDILPIASFRFETISLTVDFPGTFVEGQYDRNGTITSLTIGFDGLSVSVIEEVYSRIPAGAAVVQISASLGFDRHGGRIVTAHFFDRNTGKITLIAASEDGSSFSY